MLRNALQLRIFTGISTNFSSSIRCFNQNSTLLSRYRPRTRRPLAEPKPKDFKLVTDELQQFHADSIGLRPPSHLWRAVGFTAGLAAVSYTVAAYNDFQRQKDLLKKSVSSFFSDFSFESFFADSEGHTSHQEFKLTPGQKLVFGLIAANVVVTLLWRIPAMRNFMMQYFTNSFAQKSLCIPMVSSVFSHSSFIHLGLNMYVLHSFASVSVDRFFGVDQFLAFYLTAGAFSSLTSLIHKSAVASPVRALGASGAICALLVYTCMKIPDSRLSIVFLPMFTFSAENAAFGLMAFDLIGLIFKFKLFDHAAHLGGSIFGLWYAWYGQQFVERKFFPFIQGFLK
ncbi:unnamed protein product [Bursaphelenchus okinawaensis]|uniref:rhomboid protease n=1 Tax=Bursaphelenchus okinawaensis TaxID=465554 RepID=A0A811LV17_9BILA|nr:unnamed protein product [Bursaphelenchus okinawaensis]CAG9127828.1 unnamed protein product [Bursaphelenchus okinawaensis]